MSTLTLTKSYANGNLLLASHITGMWSQLETKTNGNIDNDNLNSGWASWASITLAKDTSFTMGATASGVLKYYDSTKELFFGFASAQSNIIFKNSGNTIMTMESDNDLNIAKDLYITNTGYSGSSVSYLLGYAKPVLVYGDSVTINVEQNTAIANNTLIMFPEGPVSVTEDTNVTSKYRQLKLTEYANGYAPGQIGSANSGFRLGLSLVSNTWYFVYAVMVQSGSDYSETSPKFVLVADTTPPYTYYHGMLDSFFTSDKWVYLGLFRYGFGLSSSTTLIPFVQDKSGWHNFIGRADTDDFFGIKTVQTTVSTTTPTTIQTYGVSTSGNSVPNTCSMMATAWKILAEGADMVGLMTFHDDAGNQIIQGPSFGANLSITDAHGIQCKLPNIGCVVKARTGA